MKKHLLEVEVLKMGSELYVHTKDIPFVLDKHKKHKTEGYNKPNFHSYGDTGRGTNNVYFTYKSLALAVEHNSLNMLIGNKMYEVQAYIEFPFTELEIIKELIAQEGINQVREKYYSGELYESKIQFYEQEALDINNKLREKLQDAARKYGITLTVKELGVANIVSGINKTGLILNENDMVDATIFVSATVRVMREVM